MDARIARVCLMMSRPRVGATAGESAVRETAYQCLGAALRGCKKRRWPTPVEMAAQMRAIVRERLAAGDSPEQVREYFGSATASGSSSRRAGRLNIVVWGFTVAPCARPWTSACCWALDAEPRAVPPGVDAA